MKLSLLHQERRLAYYMLLPSFLMVFSIVLFPVITNIWISFKPIRMTDLRKASITVTEQVRTKPQTVNDELRIRLVFRNTSATRSVEDVLLSVTIPDGLQIQDVPAPFVLNNNMLTAQYSIWKERMREDFMLSFRVEKAFLNSQLLQQKNILQTVVTGKAKNPILESEFTLDNYVRIIQSGSFFSALLITVVYSAAAAFGALLLGLVAALLVNRISRFRGLLTTFLLFPYIAPIVAVTLSWVFFLDPLSGTVNHLLMAMGLTQEGIPFFSMESFPITEHGPNIPLAMLSVVTFSAWRYFPLMFLFILARLQAIPNTLYEAAEVDGSGVLNTFFRITLPLLMPVLTTLYLIRFIWNFNKFDDVFLLTGGAAGTRTLPIEVYVQAFGLGNIGAGAAVAMFLFLFLALFLVAYTRYKPTSEDS